MSCVTSRYSYGVTSSNSLLRCDVIMATRARVRSSSMLLCASSGTAWSIPLIFCKQISMPQWSSHAKIQHDRPIGWAMREYSVFYPNKSVSMETNSPTVIPRLPPYLPTKCEVRRSVNSGVDAEQTNHDKTPIIVWCMYSFPSKWLFSFTCKWWWPFPDANYQ